ncbi:MAG: HAD family hydrolase [Armatimonadota bacterium]
MHASKLDWLFFDLGYTLIDEDGPSAQRVTDLQRALAYRSRHCSREEIEYAIQQACLEFAPRPIARAVETLAGDIPIENILKEAPYRKELEQPYPAALPVLQRLSGQYRLGIIGNQSPGTWTRLQAWGLSQFFSVCIASAEEGVVKPNLEIIRRALERAECLPGRAVMIGDRIDNDIVPAKTLGMATVRVLQGWMNVQVPGNEAEMADLAVDNLWELLPIFFHRKEISSHD